MPGAAMHKASHSVATLMSCMSFSWLQLDRSVSYLNHPELTVSVLLIGSNSNITIRCLVRFRGSANKLNYQDFGISYTNTCLIRLGILGTIVSKLSTCLFA